MNVQEAAQPPLYSEETTDGVVIVERQGCRVRGWIQSNLVVEVQR